MADPLRLVAYINGVRFWPSNVSVSCPGDDLPTFTVEVPAAPEWVLLPARSHVAIFFSDPVTKIWRLMVEGEYEGWDRQRLATGVRRMTLSCRSLHAFWETTTYANAIGAFDQSKSNPGGGVDLSRMAQLNGQPLLPETTNPAFQLGNLNTILGNSITPETRLSEFFLQLIQRITLQTPVECFYSQARGVPQKTFCFKDAQINNAASQFVFKSLIQDRLNAVGLGPMEPIKEIYQRYEAAVFYRHVGIVSPPIYKDNIIPELLFIPNLYDVVPPVCNVIFKDQIQGSAPSRRFLIEPSRVVGMMQYPGGPGSLPPYYLVNNSYESARTDDNSPVADGKGSYTMSPGMSLTHRFLTEDDLIGGVRLHRVNLPFEKIQDTTPASEANKTTPTAQLSTYIDAAMRHAFAVEKGKYRTAQFHCSFLPYVQAGFPCLIEDGDFPVHGFIERVEHQISSTSQPCTLLVVSQIREAFVIDGRNRTPPLPTWMNDRFLPKNIDDTYQHLFGPNANGSLFARAAMVNGPQLVTQTLPRLPTGVHADQVDMDKLAGLVMPVPHYDSLYQLQGPVTSMCVADRLRNAKDAQNEMLAFQYRSGTSLWQYSVMHNLDTANATFPSAGLSPNQQATSVDSASMNGSLSVNDSSKDPPADLSPTTASDKDNEGHTMFGYPLGMKMTRNALSVPLTSQPPGQKSTQYGVYELVAGGAQTTALISPARQQIARMIAKALLRGITSTG